MRPPVRGQVVNGFINRSLHTADLSGEASEQLPSQRPTRIVSAFAVCGVLSGLAVAPANASTLVSTRPVEERSTQAALTLPRTTGAFTLAGGVTIPPEARSEIQAVAGLGLGGLALKQGRVIAFGNDIYGYGHLNVPTEAQSNVDAIAGGDWTSLALKQGKVIAWGSNYDKGTSVPADALENVTAIAAGRNVYLALREGRVIAWGNNSSGLNQVPAQALSGVDAISTQQSHALALKDGRVIGWGDPRFAEVPDEAKARVDAISAGAYHSLALRDGRVVSWGENGVQPVPTEAQSGVTAVAAGEGVSYAIKNGEVLAWNSDGRLRTGLPADSRSGVVGLSEDGQFAYKNSAFSPPVEVSATEGDGRASLSWDIGTLERPLVTGYRVESATAGSNDWTTEIADTGSTATRTELLGLTNGTALHFRVSALVGETASGVSSPSTPVVLGPADQLRRVTGTARTAEGAALPGLYWKATDQDDTFTSYGKTDDNGGFEFRARATAPTILDFDSVYYDKFLSGQVVVPSGQENVQITLGKTYSSAVVVTDKYGHKVRAATVAPADVYGKGTWQWQVPGFPDLTAHGILPTSRSDFSTGTDGRSVIVTPGSVPAGNLAEVTANIEPDTKQKTTVKTSSLQGGDPYNRVALAVLPYAPIMEDAATATSVPGEPQQSARAARSSTSKAPEVIVRTPEGRPLPDTMVQLVPVLNGDTADSPREGSVVASATTSNTGKATFEGLADGKYRAIPVNVSARTVDFTISNGAALPPVELPPAQQPPVAPPVVTPPDNPSSTPAAGASRDRATVSVKAIAKKSRLRVDVDPNMGTKAWTFTVQYKDKKGRWKVLDSGYRTRGRSETRTLDLGKGTYRVIVKADHGYRGTTSKAVRLQR